MKFPKLTTRGRKFGLAGLVAALSLCAALGTVKHCSSSDEPGQKLGFGAGGPGFTQPNPSVVSQLVNAGSFFLTGEQADTSTGTVNNFAVGANVAVLRWNGAGTATFTGFAGGVNGRLLIVVNEATSQTILIANESGTSTAANRVTAMGGSQMSVANRASILLRYDGASSRWRPVSWITNIFDTSVSFNGSVLFAAAQSPTSISGTVNDWAPTNVTFRNRIAASADATITGMATGGTAGRFVWLQNISAFKVTIAHEGAGSTAANRFTDPGGVDWVLPPGASAFTVYDSNTSRWILFPDGSCYSAATTGQPFQSVAISGSTFRTGVQSDTSTGTVNDFVVNDNISRLRFTPGSTLTINGFKCGSVNCDATFDGRELEVCNLSSAGNVVISYDSASASANNRILGSSNNTTTLASGGTNPNACSRFTYDGTTLKWRQIGMVQSNTIVLNTGITAGSYVTTGPGHIRDNGTDPTLSTCGGSPTVVGGDAAMKITTGSAATACTVTFAGTFTVAPSCVGQAEVAGTGIAITASSATAITFTAGASTVYNIHCFGTQ